MRFFSLSLLLCIAFTIGCGGGQKQAPAASSVSGNWQFALTGSNPPSINFTGFLLGSGGSVTGNLLEAVTSSCSGVGTVTGTVSGQNVSLNISQSGAGISLTGTMASGSPTSGSFTSQPGVCSFIPTSGTWSAVQIATISGGFHGTFTSLAGNGTVTVKGTLNQAPNTGSSTANLSGTLTTTSAATFCSYVLPGTITGLISGTDVALSLYGENGLQYAQLGGVGSSGVTLAPDGSSLTGTYFFPTTTNSCPSDQGSFTLSFP